MLVALLPARAYELQGSFLSLAENCQRVASLLAPNYYGHLYYCKLRIPNGAYPTEYPMFVGRQFCSDAGRV